MTEWIAIGLGAVACAAVIGWLRAYREAKDWERCCVVLGEQYDQMVNEEFEQPDTYALTAPKPSGQRWLN